MKLHVAGTVKRSMFDVPFFVNPSYETSVSFSIRLAVFLVGGWADTQ